MAAYGSLYERHRAAAYNLARQLARSRTEADDLVSEAFARVLDTPCAGAVESTAVVPIPSLTSFEAFDSGVLFESRVAERLIDHARQVYAGARKVETEQARLALPTVRS
jgi:Sigma-70 region 2